ncbi:CotH kinase family protein, partial [Streptococcus agalactiae]
ATEYLSNYIDETRHFLDPAIDRNYKKWGYVFDLKNTDPRNYLIPTERNVTSYHKSVEQLKDFIKKRGRWMDRNIETLYQYSAPSKNTNTLLE